MVDVVANHMAWDGKSDNVDYSTLVPFNKKEDFHTNPTCFISNYDNQTEVENVSSREALVPEWGTDVSSVG